MGLRVTLAALLATLLLDQASKVFLASLIAPGERVVLTSFAQLVAVYNPGAAFSLFAEAGGWQRWFLLALAVVVAVWLIWEGHRSSAWPAALGCGLVAGGALGNAWDRLLHGAVFDFILLHYRSWAWPAFNLADSAISVGVVLLLWSSFRVKKAA